MFNRISAGAGDHSCFLISTADDPYIDCKIVNFPCTCDVCFFYNYRLECSPIIMRGTHPAIN